MRPIDDAPVSAALKQRTLAAARAARKRRLSVFGAAAAMSVATAAVACVLLMAGPWRAAKANPAFIFPAATAAPAASAAPTAAPSAEATEGSEAERELACVAVPLVGGLDSGEIKYDGAFNVLVEPGKLDEAMVKYHVKADRRDSRAATMLEELRVSGKELRLVLAMNPSCTPRLSSAGLYLRQGTAVFRFTDCVGGVPSLYDGLDEGIGRFGFLVEIPEEAAGLPFVSASIPWKDVAGRKKLEIMLERIMTNGEVQQYLASAKPDRKAIPQIYLEKSPKEAGAIASTGQEAATWLKTRYETLFPSGGGLPFELDVISLLMEKAAVYANPDSALEAWRKQLTAQHDNSTIHSALARYLVTHILDENGADSGAGRVQVCALYFLKEPDGSNRIAAAALASILRGDGKPSTPKLYVAEASFASNGAHVAPEWILQDIDIRARSEVDSDEYPALGYQGGQDVVASLYGYLNWQFGQLGIETSFNAPPANEDGAYATLHDKTGMLRRVRLSLWVQPEKSAGGIDNLELEQADGAAAIRFSPRLIGLSGGKWTPVGQFEYEQACRTQDGAGIHRIMLELELENSEGLWAYCYQFNVQTKTVTLRRWKVTTDGLGGEPECFVCADPLTYDKALLPLGADTDVSGLLIDDTPGLTLPPDRDELKYIVAWVQDMPGGIAAIEPAVLCNDGLGGQVEKRLPKLTEENKAVEWAKSLGALLGSEAMTDNPAVHAVEALPAGMAAEVGAGRPALLRWDVDAAAQEGKAKLTIWANPETKQVWSETTYRLYGSTNLNKWYTATNEGDDRLYQLLIETTFGKDISVMEDLP